MSLKFTVHFEPPDLMVYVNVPCYFYITISLFPRARARPSLTSLRTGYKIKVISREFIATPQTIVVAIHAATP